MLLDPRLCEFELPLRRRFFPLGFPLDLETNSFDVIEAAEEGWGAFSQAFEASTPCAWPSELPTATRCR